MLVEDEYIVPADFFSQQKIMTCSWNNGTIDFLYEDTKKIQRNVTMEDLLARIPGTYTLCYKDEQGRIEEFSIDKLSEMKEKAQPLKVVVDASAKYRTVFTIMKRSC